MKSTDNTRQILLKASSLDAPYKLLADFNGYVLGGMESGHCVQLIS